jgi:HAD superfamily hydrolase (TIGR01509 family)
MNQSRVLKGVVFDLDGTLVDSLGTTFDAFNEAFVRLGGTRRTPEQIMAHFGTGEGEIFVQMIGREKAKEAYFYFREYFDQHIKTVPLHSGVKELLDDLKALDIPISIFTGRGWETTQLILNHHGLTDRFVTVVAHDHVKKPKPSPEGLFLAMSRMSLVPQEILFVGDSPVDIQAANSAGSSSAAALWDGIANRTLLESQGPTFLARTPSEINECLLAEFS